MIQNLVLKVKVDILAHLVDYMFQQSNTGFYCTLNSWPPSTSASSCLGVLFSINAKFLHIQRIPNL